MSRSTPIRATILSRALAGAAFAMAAGSTALVAPTAAMAQEAPKLSKGFNSAAAPMAEAFETAKADPAFANADAATKATMLAGALGALAAAEPTIENATDRLTWGQYAYNLGRETGDAAMQRRGVEAMIASGLITGENFIALNEAAGQFAYNAQDWEAARRYLQAALDAGSTNSQLSGLIAETYIKAGDGNAALPAVEQLIAERAAASPTGYADENVYKRALKLTYESGMMDKAVEYALILAEAYPSENSFGDAIQLVRSGVSMDDEAALDLMRLMGRTDTFKSSNDYTIYANLLDARRYPGEVVSVLDRGIAAGVLSSSSVGTLRSEASGRVASDRASLPEIERDARRNGAAINTVMGAGDAFLSYGMADKATDMYRIAIDTPGVDRNRALTRLGIALADQGMFAEAQEVFGQVGGERAALGRLWAAYAASEAS